MVEIQPPFLTGLGPAPSGVCSRWLEDSPCGAAATHHVIWSTDMRNGARCPEHERETRRKWVYVGLHPYTVACAAGGRAEWIEDEDRCVLAEPQPHRALASEAVA